MHDTGQPIARSLILAQITPNLSDRLLRKQWSALSLDDNEQDDDIR